MQPPFFVLYGIKLRRVRKRTANDVFFRKMPRGVMQKKELPCFGEKQGSMVHVLRKNITGGEICFACMF